MDILDLCLKKLLFILQPMSSYVTLGENNSLKMVCIDNFYGTHSDTAILFHIMTFMMHIVDECNFFIPLCCLSYLLQFGGSLVKKNPVNTEDEIVFLVADL